MTGRKRAALLLALCWLALCVRSAPAAEEEWAMVTAALVSDDADPVPLSWQISPPPQPEREEGPFFTMLLLSSDAPDTERDRGRTDVMMLLSVSRETGDARLLALPEMTPVQMEELPGPIRLKYVNCFGGPRLALREVNRLLGTQASRYCTVNTEGFVSLIDRLGGVLLPLTASERQYLGVQESPGRLNGEQALRYAKLRREEAVSSRPRLLLEALLQEAASGGAEAVLSLAGGLLPMLQTDLTTEDLLDLLFAVLTRDEPGGLETAALPEGENGVDGQTAAWCRAFLYGGE